MHSSPASLLIRESNSGKSHGQNTKDILLIYYSHILTTDVHAFWWN